MILFGCGVVVNVHIPCTNTTVLGKWEDGRGEKRREEKRRRWDRRVKVKQRKEETVAKGRG